MSTFLQIEPAYEKALCAAGLHDFDAFLTASAGRPTSKHEHRETVPIHLTISGEARTFYLKRVFQVPPKHALWPMFRLRRPHSQPRLEWRICRRLRQAGIAAMKPVAFGERRRLGLPRQAFLLVESVPATHTIENWLVPGFPRPHPIPKRLRDRLFFELGLLIRRLHDTGADWPDLHAKHIYARPRPSATDGNHWDFFLIDLERMRIGPPSSDAGGVSPPARTEGLSRALERLTRSLKPLVLNQRDARRFLAGAFLTDGASLLHRPDRNLLRGREAFMNIRLAVSEDGPRLPNDYKHPCAVRFRQLGAMIADEREVPLLQAAGIHDLDDVFRYDDGHLLAKPGLAAHRDRLRMDLIDDAGRRRTLYLKRYRRPPVRAQIRRILESGWKSSTASRELRCIERLSTIGVPTLRRIASGQEMHGPWEERSFVLTEAIAGDSLEEIARRATDDPGFVPSPRERRVILRQLALIARRLHRHGLYHRDFYLCHVFLTRNTDRGIVLRVLDLARMLESPMSPQRWKIKDLAALDYSAPSPLVTRADRLRFLYHYLFGKDRSAERRERDDPSAKRRIRFLTRRIQARTRRMARHDVNRVRRLRKGEQA